MRPDLSKLVFDHIPKSGGTTVQGALRDAFGCDYRVNWGNPADGRTFINELRFRTCFTSSHHAYHSATFEPRDDEYYITWVRDPVDMVYSSYAFFTKTHKRIQGVKPEHLFERIMEYGSLVGYIDAVLASERLFFPETMYTGRDFSKYDYVGSCARMDECLGELFGLLELEAPETIRTLNVHTTPEGRTYRREELGERLAPELEVVERWL